ncbi:DUF4038 domain-containing protein, partial [Candidatus Sumerlaeota bacterium]|nr:DUF4038 domain-containing protein [Candidatus Sumerlaeota bacterium]
MMTENPLNDRLAISRRRFFGTAISASATAAASGLRSTAPVFAAEGIASQQPRAGKKKSGATSAPAAFPLKLSANRRHLADQKGKPFFVLGDTPWFLQKLPLEDVRRILDDRKAKGFNTLFLEFLGDQRIPSPDAHGTLAFLPDTD